MTFSNRHERYQIFVHAVTDNQSLNFQLKKLLRFASQEKHSFILKEIRRKRKRIDEYYLNKNIATKLGKVSKSL